MKSKIIAGWRIGLLFGWGLWWGSLTFYSAIVVPIGTDQIGSVEQGFITQQVTLRHNLLTGAFTVCLLIEFIRNRNLMLGAIVVGLAIIEVALVILHMRLSESLDLGERSVSVEFYSEHAIYLWLTTIEWCLGCALPIILRWPAPNQPDAIQARSASE